MLCEEAGLHHAPHQPKRQRLHITEDFTSDELCEASHNSSTHSTTAASGGLRYRPMTSKTFSTNSGSLDSLKESARCGLSSNARQIRPIVDLDQPAALGHLRPRPVRRIRRRGLQRGHHHVLDLLGADRRRAPRSRIIAQPIQPQLDEPGPPLTHRRLSHALTHRNILVAQPRRAAQHDPRAQRQRLRRRPPPSPPLQLDPLLLRQLQHGLRATSSRHTPVYDICNELTAHDTRDQHHPATAGPVSFSGAR